jgi:predicted PurR-regulated permease PerM
MSLVARSEYAVHQLMKRKNWAQREPGVIVVFVIVFLVAILVIAMFINKKVCLHQTQNLPVLIDR